MLDKLNPYNILFLDIETVPQYKDYSELPERLKYLWEKKSERIRSEEETAEGVYQRAGIYSEFGKIVCISVGIFKQGSVSEYGFRVKSFYGDDEKALLEGFAEMLKKFSSKDDARLCAHNGKEFDFPYIARRMLINRLPIPEILNVPGKKPWEVQFLDTMELWKFGDYKNYTSLDLLTYIFDIPTPKDDIDGSMVGKVYWEDNDVERIVHYCEKDTLAVAQLFLRFKGQSLVDEQDVETATN
jgi:hypothetical protein